MKAFIVEDEPIARERLKRLLKEVGGVDIVGEADSKEKALSDIKDKEIDVLFLDIKLPDGTGLEVAKGSYRNLGRPTIHNLRNRLRRVCVGSLQSKCNRLPFKALHKRRRRKGTKQNKKHKKQNIKPRKNSNHYHRHRHTHTRKAS
jgi:Response regulator of the LytR/AlgR family